MAQLTITLSFGISSQPFSSTAVNRGTLLAAAPGHLTDLVLCRRPGLVPRVKLVALFEEAVVGWEREERLKLSGEADGLDGFAGRHRSDHPPFTLPRGEGKLDRLERRALDRRAAQKAASTNVMACLERMVRAP